MVNICIFLVKNPWSNAKWIFEIRFSSNHFHNMLDNTNKMLDSTSYSFLNHNQNDLLTL